VDGQPLTVIIHGDGAIKTQMDVDPGAGIRAAAGAGEQVQQTIADLDRIVVGNGALLLETTDRLEDLGRWGGSPRGREVHGAPREAGIVAREKARQDALRVRERLRVREAQFGDEPVLKGAKEPFDTAFSLGRVGGDPADAQFLERAADLRGVVVPAELLGERHGRGARKRENTMAIRVHRAGDAMAAEQLPQEEQIAGGVLGQAKESGEDPATGVIDGREEDEARSPGFEPGMMAAIELDQQARLRHARAAPTMAGRSAGAGTAEPRAAEEALEGAAGDRETFALAEHLRQVVIVEAGIGGPC